MLQGIIIALLFILVAIAIVVMLAFTFVVRWMRKLRNMMTGGKEQEDTSSRFHADYTGRRQQSYGYTNDKWTRANEKKRGSRGRIIDQRDPKTANRKIIDDNVGEYVDFEETK